MRNHNTPGKSLTAVRLPIKTHSVAVKSMSHNKTSSAGFERLAAASARDDLASIPDGSAHCPFALLSPGELKFLSHLAEGLSYEQIADGMDISINTVRSYVRSVYKKLCVNSRTRAVIAYLRKHQNTSFGLPIRQAK